MKDVKEPLLLLLILFILVGLAYSPLKKANLNQNTTNENSSAISSNQVSKENIGNSANQEIADNIKSTEKSLNRLEEDLNKKITESKRSPYYGKIRMSGLSGLYGNNPYQEYTNLYVYLEKNETLKITGWYLKSEITGYYAVIGKASLLPFPFTKTESDIILQNNDRVILTKGFSPIGISFRTNKCTGYFEENRTFAPSLSSQCPRPIDEKLPKFSEVHDRNDECLNILERIPQCTTKGTDFTRKLPDTVSSICKNYILTQIDLTTLVFL
jgi:hypothetical protein